MIEEAIVSLVTDDTNEEGICGTVLGNVYFFSFKDKEKVKLISSPTPNKQPLTMLKYEPHNPVLFLTNTGEKNCEVKLYTSTMVDLVMSWAEKKGPVRFILPLTGKHKKFVIGHSKGHIFICNLEELTCRPEFKLSLKEGEEVTCAASSPGGYNFCVGTSIGELFIISYPYQERR